MGCTLTKRGNWKNKAINEIDGYGLFICEMPFKYKQVILTVWANSGWRDLQIIKTPTVLGSQQAAFWQHLWVPGVDLNLYGDVVS